MFFRVISFSDWDIMGWKSPSKHHHLGFPIFGFLFQNRHVQVAKPRQGKRTSRILPTNMVSMEDYKLLSKLVYNLQPICRNSNLPFTKSHGHPSSISSSTTPLGPTQLGALFFLCSRSKKVRPCGTKLWLPAASATRRSSTLLAWSTNSCGSRASTCNKRTLGGLGTACRISGELQGEFF